MVACGHSRLGAFAIALVCAGLSDNNVKILVLTYKKRSVTNLIISTIRSVGEVVVATLALRESTSSADRHGMITTFYVGTREGTRDGTASIKVCTSPGITVTVYVGANVVVAGILMTACGISGVGL